MGRTYHLGQREAGVEETRANIIAAACDVLLGPDGMSATVADVAKAAGVTRQTVYQHFGSRSDLYVGMLDDALAGAEVKGLVAALQAKDPLVAFRRGIAEACRVWAANRDAFRRIAALADVDPGVAELSERREQVRRGYATFIIGRLHDAGLLRRGLGAEDALLVLEAATRFESFDYLHGTRKLSLRKTVAILTHIAERAILQEPSPAPAARRDRALVEA